MNLRRVILFALIAAGTQVQAQFTGVSQAGDGTVYQADHTVILNHFTPGGSSFSAHEPLTTNFDGLDSMTTQLDFTATNTILSNYIQMDGSFSGQAITHYGNSSGALEATAQAYSEVFFTSPGAAYITMQAFNAHSSGSGFDLSYSEMNFDGAYYQFSPGNTYASFNVGAGAHFMWFETSCNVYSGSSYGTDSSSTISSDYRLTASTTPEPMK